jgi:OmpA-OmpF porin, OOP family
MKYFTTLLSAIKLIAITAVFMPAISLFSLQSRAQTSSNNATSMALQERIEQQELRVKPLRAAIQPGTSTYALEKAQCWIDFSRHEALRNNPTRIPDQSLRKAQGILDALEAKTSPGAQLLDSALQVGATDSVAIPSMRKDLWQQFEAIKASRQFVCAAKEIACGEVMLVQAAHAHERIDWRYSRPYFGMAEDLLRSARQKVSACPVTP